MTDLLLVPVLPGGNVMVQDRRRWNSAPSVISISPKTGSNDVEIGRLELLSSYYSSCGCSKKINSTQGKCQSCQRITSGAIRFLSRKMLRFSTCSNDKVVRLAVRGKFASVLVKQKHEEEFTPVTFLERDGQIKHLDDWRGSQELHPGMRLCIVGPSTSEGEGEGGLEFEVFDRERPKMIVYIVRFGQDLPERRVTLLQNEILQRGILLARNYRGATHIVVSRHFNDLEHLAKHLGSSATELQHHFDENNVQCLLPQWTACLEEDQTLPYQWMGYSKTLTRYQKNPVKRLPPESAIGTRRYDRNAFLAKEFVRLSKAYERGPIFEDEELKALQFHKLAGRLQCLDFEINVDNFSKQIQRLKKVKGFGNTAIETIQNIFVHGFNHRAKCLETDPARVAIGNMMGIHGVGRATALDLYQLGYDSIQSLRDAVDAGKLTLTREQRIGLDCYEDIQEEISCDEVESIGRIVIDAYSCITDLPAEATIMGSYRRGKAFSGDVDILVTMKDYPENIPRYALSNLIEFLNEHGHIAHHLTLLPGVSPPGESSTTEEPSTNRALSKSQQGLTRSSKSYMGVFFSPKYPGKRRRVDIKIYPYNQKAFASLYFTGGKWFNRSMRLWAKQKFNWRLSDKGITDIGSGRIILKTATNEQEIFRKLRLKYKSPPERTYFDDVEPL